MSASEISQGAIKVPYLECYAERGGPPERVPLLRVPFVIGRSEAVDHRVYSSKVSKEHAAIGRVGDRYTVKDLASTNGTFVNGQRTSEAFLRDGDIIQTADKEFRFRHPAVDGTRSDTQSSVEQTQLMSSDSLDSVIRGTQLLEAMIADEAVDTLYQPIVDLGTREVIGYEALSRGTHPKLSASPAVLLRLAEQCDTAVALSECFRNLAIRASAVLPSQARIFLNTHAREVSSPGFLDALAALRGDPAIDRPIVIEIAETSITDVLTMAKIKKAVHKLGFELAYDDFGIGQARFLELTDVPPDFLKLDIALIQDIDTNKPRQEIVSAVLRVVSPLGTRVVAEGIETAEVAEVCRDLGCHLGQGYYFGRPA
jgi:EAL domain-containing protein (putative c-di-GMP-specific phosphodiesterase class I)